MQCAPCGFLGVRYPWTAAVRLELCEDLFAPETHTHTHTHLRLWKNASATGVDTEVASYKSQSQTASDGPYKYQITCSPVGVPQQAETVRLFVFEVYQHHMTNILDHVNVNRVNK